MAVERIEEYTQKNGEQILKVYCKPTTKFPEGKNYFYAPIEASDLVKQYAWVLHKNYKRIVVTCSKSPSMTLYFHRELANLYITDSSQYMYDHINHVEFDNTDRNLNAVSYTQNNINKLTKGYTYISKQKRFSPQCKINRKGYVPFGTFYMEDEAYIYQNKVEQEFLRNKIENNCYLFDFLKYRRGSEDILDLERTGKITEEEATYRHILRYSTNAWYYLRFGLAQYFKDNKIPIPQYDLDENGFMVDINTRQRLCPFT